DQAQAIYDKELTYSPLIENYFDLIPERQCRKNREIFSNQDAFQDFQYSLRSQHRKFLHDLKAKNKLNSEKLRDYFRRILEQHRKLLLVRVDLSYRYDANITLETFDQDIKILVNRIQNKDTCFKGQVGYAYRLEQGGKSKGYHCHLLVIYNGSQHCRDSYLAQEIGELWKDRITD
ncbi:YagK/YfjJ domain-containing protein, partial [Acinetobacter sp. ANC 3791]